jgi:O-antigen/teichoic acid export membrane protein
VRSSIAIALGAGLILAGAKAWGPIGGLLAGMLLAVATVFRGDWTALPRGLDRAILAKVCRYGLPLSMTVALAVVISSSDRFLIAWLLGADAAGQYSAAVDFTSQTLTLLLVVVHMAIFPLAVQAWERGGSAAAQERMRGNALLLLALGVPCVVGMIILAPGITALVLGSKFRAAASGIIPLIAVGTFLAGFKAYHFDAAFQFAHRTLSQVWIVLAAAIVNIALNVALIPLLGINGAALASLLAYVVSIGLTVIIGRRHFVVPLPARASLPVLIAAAAMAALLLPLRHRAGAAAVAAQIIGGAALYGALLVAMNFLDLRDHLARWWRRTRPAPSADAAHPVGIAPSLAQRD